MYNNLVNEIVKKGYKTEEIAHILANLLNCSEEVIENKLKHVGEFTFQEVIKINSEIFNNEMDIKYLFTKCERKAPKFIYGDISSLKNNDSISLFFIVLYF